MTDTPHISYISSHCNGIRVKKSDTPLVEYKIDCSEVRNESSVGTTATVYFPLPNPEVGTPNLTDLNVDLTTKTVITTAIHIYGADDLVFSKTFKKSAPFELRISDDDSTRKYNGGGLCVAIELDMEPNSKIQFKSVSIKCCAS